MSKKIDRTGLSSYLTKEGHLRWIARYTVPDTGKKLSKGGFLAASDASEWRRSQITAHQNGTWEAPAVVRARREAQSVTVADYARQYVAAQVAGATRTGRPMSPKTAYDYGRYVARFLDGDPLGELPIASVTVSNAEAWRLRVLKHGASTTANAYRFVKAVHQHAVRFELIERNPFCERGAAKVERVKKITGATDAEVARLAQAMPERLVAAVYVAAYTGIRRSELRGLRRRDVDVEALRLHVQGQAQDVGGHTVERDDTKSVASTASAALPEPVARLLAAHMKKYTGAGPDAYVFAGVTGKPVADSVLRRAWDRARDSVGRRDDLDWHDLRHTGAMKVYKAQGLRAAQRFLRHATPAATMIYLHVTDDDLDNAVALLGAQVVLPQTRHLRVA